MCRLRISLFSSYSRGCSSLFVFLQKTSLLLHDFNTEWLCSPRNVFSALCFSVECPRNAAGEGRNDPSKTPNKRVMFFFGIWQWMRQKISCSFSLCCPHSCVFEKAANGSHVGPQGGHASCVGPICCWGFMGGSGALGVFCMLSFVGNVFCCALHFFRRFCNFPAVFPFSPSVCTNLKWKMQWVPAILIHMGGGASFLHFFLADLGQCWHFFVVFFSSFEYLKVFMYWPDVPFRPNFSSNFVCLFLFVQQFPYLFWIQYPDPYPDPDASFFGIGFQICKIKFFWIVLIFIKKCEWHLKACMLHNGGKCWRILSRIVCTPDAKFSHSPPPAIPPLGGS